MDHLCEERQQQQEEEEEEEEEDTHLSDMHAAAAGCGRTMSPGSSEYPTQQVI